MSLLHHLVEALNTSGGPLGGVSLEEFRRVLEPQSRTAGSHFELLDNMKRTGALASPQIMHAFAAVDRAAFAGVTFGSDDPEGEMSRLASMIYSDRPFRAGAVHLSAPSIYAKALAALDLRPGLSFLNVGSGTGYLSSMVAELIGPHAIHHGIEINPLLTSRARALARSRGLGAIRFHTASVHQLDVYRSIGVDRIYVGAGASGAVKRRLLRLLKPGGVMVGQFEDDDEGDQSLQRIERLPTGSRPTSRPLAASDVGTRGEEEEGGEEKEGEEEEAGGEEEEEEDDDDDDAAALTPDRPIYRTELLMRVSFAPLHPGVLSNLGGADGADDAAAAAPSPSTEGAPRLVLRGPKWGVDDPRSFPPSFRRVAALLLWAAATPTPDGDAEAASAGGGGGAATTAPPAAAAASVVAPVGHMASAHPALHRP